MRSQCSLSSFFFFNDTATTEIYTLSLHDALPICQGGVLAAADRQQRLAPTAAVRQRGDVVGRLQVEGRSEEHTSELQSRQYLVCRLLLEKKKSIAGVFTGYALHEYRITDHEAHRE